MQTIREFGDLKCNLKIATLRKYVSRSQAKRTRLKCTLVFLSNSGFVIVGLVYRGKQMRNFYRYHGVTRRLHNPKNGFSGFVIRLGPVSDNS